MPTGYTAPVADGVVTDFKTFALQCARNFGALILMRDDPRDATIPDKFQPSDYSLKRAQEAKDKLHLLRHAPDGFATEQAQKAYADECAARKKRRAEKRLTQQRYESMLHDVEKWQPPTPDHAGLKKFMVDQLKESIDFDCRDYQRGDEPRLLTGDQWLHNEIETCIRDIAYHEQAYADEVRRTNGRNEWVKALRESLEGVTK